MNINNNKKKNHLKIKYIQIRIYVIIKILRINTESSV